MPHPVASANSLSAREIDLWARLLQSADSRRIDEALIDSALSSTSSHLRAAAALAVGQLHAAADAPRLRSLLGDRDSAVAANAAFALGLLRDSASAAALGAALDVCGPVSSEAAWALGEIGAPARSVIADALGASRPRTCDSAVPSLLMAAGRLRPTPAELILPELTRTATRPEVLRAAAYALARVRLPAAVRPLAALSRSGDPETREHVARALARSAAGDSLADTALAALVVLARDPVAHVRVNAVRSLGSYAARARRPLLAATADPDPNVRVAVAQSLAGVLPPTRREWRAAWDADTGFMYRRSLLASAVTSGVILDAIDEDNPDDWQRDTDWRYRAAVAEAAAGAPQIERVVEVALPLTRDHDGRVRAAAYGVFAPWLDSTDAARHPWRRQFLLPALRDPDPVVRATALGALANHARAAELPAVLASYALSAGDTINDARVAGARYFAAAWRLDSASVGDALRAALASLPAPSDPLVVEEARGSTPLAHWRLGTHPPHPTEWYEAAVRDYVIPALSGRPVMADISTERGTMTVAFFGADAPLTVRNFVELARAGYYAGARFHRVVPNFVAQDGDPRGDGNGGPGYSIRDELNRRRYERGAVGMALSGPDTGGSQYFLTLSRQPHLDGHYTVFGRLASGEEVMDRLVQGDAILAVRVR